MDPSTLDKTLQDLENDDWGEPTYPSHLVTECHRLRRVPLREFTVEDLRIVIGQSFSLTYLMPLALDILENDPWVSGDYFEGDLLLNAVRADPEYWKNHPALATRMDTIVTDAQRMAAESVDDCYSGPRCDHVLFYLERWVTRRSPAGKSHTL